MHSDEVMEAIDARFSSADPELSNGFAEHVPMGADALLALGVSPSAVMAWAQRHEPAALAEDAPIARRRLGIVAEIDRDGWEVVLGSHATPLASAVAAHLFHGLIRTAHAVRALRRAETSAARAELATGLAAWHVWAERDEHRADTSDEDVSDPDATILDAAIRGAHAFVSSPSIFTLHAVTAPMAFLLMSDHLDRVVRSRAAAAFVRSHRRHERSTGDAGASDAAMPTRRQLDALAEQWDAHPAKLVEAALRGHALSGDPVFLRAARQVLGT